MKSKKTYYFLIIICVLLGIFGVPFIINICFQQDAPANVLIAKWSAGDALSFYGAILTFIGTTIISIVALWQNQKYKEDNDAAQKRLEDISQRANELNAINTIIEYELKKYERLEKLLEDFFEITQMQNMALNLASDDELLFSTAQIKNTLDFTYASIAKELRYRNNRNDASFAASVCELYDNTKAILLALKNGKTPTEDIVKAHHTCWIKYANSKSKFLLMQRKNLDRVIYSNLSLEEIKKVFTVNSKEAVDNGQTENAQCE